MNSITKETLRLVKSLAGADLIGWFFMMDFILKCVAFVGCIV
jgi:hypothetical protein